MIIVVAFFLFAFAEKKQLSNINSQNSVKENYAKIFGTDYQNALNFMKVNKKYIDKILDNEDIEKKMIISFLFPERIRFSIISDYLETEITESIYVNYGKQYVDFSIGHFQMKPSFVEKLEEIISTKENFKEKYSEIISYDTNDEIEIRRKRIERLKSFQWQLKYARAFYSIICFQFDLSALAEKEKIEFIASAYNSDFTSAKDKIIKNIDYEAFPYGNTYPLKQYSYAKVAAYFYENNYEEIINY